MRGLSLVAASGGHSSSRCAGLSPLRPLLLWSTGSRRAGSAIVAHGPSRSAACEIFPDQGSNPCSLHWQADSQPLRHQGSPHLPFLIAKTIQRTQTVYINRTALLQAEDRVQQEKGMHWNLRSKLYLSFYCLVPKDMFHIHMLNHNRGCAKHLNTRKLKNICCEALLQ